MNGSDRWSDLSARIMSALMMVAVGFGAIWAGGWVFALFLALVCAGMAWELTRMLAPDASALALAMAALSGAALVLATGRGPMVTLALLAVPVLAAALLIVRDRRLGAAYLALILTAGAALGMLRLGAGMVPVLWLIAVVVASDVAGYFAGKALGGPKLWPRVSPKKTWSGTVAGWLAAALIGYAATRVHGGGVWWVLLAVAAAMAAQAGDIAESAIKRHAGVKDSSGLIPGHGGLLDRFDGVLGAAALLLALWLIRGLI